MEHASVRYNGKLKEEWTRAHNTFKEGVKFKINKSGNRIHNNLPKNNTSILHVRPMHKNQYI